MCALVGPVFGWRGGVYASYICPTHGGYSPPALHQPANHPQTNNSAYPRALKRGGRRRRTPPTTTTITVNTSTRTQTIKSGQLTLLNPFPRHQNYTTPPHHRGLPPGAATPPIPPYPWFPQQRWSRLEWVRGIGSATPDPPYAAIPLDCGGQPPHTWHDDLCGFLKLCYNAVWTG